LRGSKRCCSSSTYTRAFLIGLPMGTTSPSKSSAQSKRVASTVTSVGP
jgi:hypothetical protein